MESDGSTLWMSEFPSRLAGLSHFHRRRQRRGLLGLDQFPSRLAGLSHFHQVWNSLEAYQASLEVSIPSSGIVSFPLALSKFKFFIRDSVDGFHPV